MIHIVRRRHALQHACLRRGVRRTNRTRMRRWGCVIAATLLLLLAACGQPAARNASAPSTVMSQPAAEPSTAAEVATPWEPVRNVFFPQQASVDGPRVVMEAFLVGPLSEEAQCLRVRDRTADTSYLIVWPPGVQLRRTEDRLVVVTDMGQVIAAVGETIRITGGTVPTATDIESRQPLSQPVPPSCPGPYWIVGEELGRSAD